MSTSGQRAWTTNDELSYIRSISDIAILRGYVKSIPGRKNWGAIDSVHCQQLATSRLHILTKESS